MVGKRIKPQADGCWIIDGNPNKYAKVNFGQGSFPEFAHRWVYEMLVGPIPPDHVLHHKCEVKGCVNPAHLEPLTHSDHMSLHHQLRRTA
jgi:hypothetical protein